MVKTNKSEKGATLIVALIILLALSVIGISSMKGSISQEKMAGNFRQKTVSKNAAVVALREAELWLRANVPDYPQVPSLGDFNGSNGLYSEVVRPGALVAVPVPSSFDLTDPEAWTSYGVASAAVSAELVSQQPKYIIEYIGRDYRGTSGSTVTSHDQEDKNNKQINSYMFRITAIGWGKNNNIATVLQGTYVTGVTDGA